MKLKHLTSLILICMWQVSLAENQAETNEGFYSEEMGIWYQYPIPPKKTIATQNIFKSLSKGDPLNITFTAPKPWPVRALYIGVSDELYEFDEDGNVLYDGDYQIGKDATGKTSKYLRQVLINGSPLWIGATVFNIISSDRNESESAWSSTYPNGLIKGTNGGYCPARPAKKEKELNMDRFWLDGDCDNAISLRGGISKYFTYPGFEGIKDPYFYWTIQYFDEPKSPFPSPGEGCRLYCEN